MIFSLILLIVIVFILIGATLLHVGEASARAEANRIIDGEEQATEEQINKIITTLLRAKHFWGGKTEQDRYRIKQLREMRNKMVTPETQGH